jgi:hypothetical protein
MTSPPVSLGISPGIGSAWPGAGPLVTDVRQPVLDLSAAVGQMSYSWRFELVNAVTDEHLGDIEPIRNASLSHDTGMTTKRRLSLSLGRADTAEVNALTDRVRLFMTIPGAPNPDRDDGDWPLGRYAWSDNPRQVTTAGRLAQPTLNDEMFVIDQELDVGLNGRGQPIVTVIGMAVSGLGVTVVADPSPYTSAEAWSSGTNRGQVLEAIAVTGDYWSPWFDNNGDLRFLRTFDPASAVVDIDLDAGYQVLREGIVENDGLLTAPNRIIVVSNAARDPGGAVVAVRDVPVTAPNSIANIGTVRSKQYTLQISDPAQAIAVANGLAERNQIFETVTLSTAADPRHDSYNVLRWQGDNWLELAWSMPLTPGAPMTHTMRKSYAA